MEAGRLLGGDFVWATLYGRLCMGDFVWATFGGRFCMGDFVWATLGGRLLVVSRAPPWKLLILLIATRNY
jgi:hypothetical protein